MASDTHELDAITFTFDRKMVKQAQKESFWHTMRRPWMLVFCICGLGALIVFTAIETHDVVGSVLGGVIIAAITLVVLRLAMGWLMFSLTPKKNLPYDLSLKLSDEHLTMEQIGNKVAIRWSEVKLLNETENFLHVRAGGAGFTLPKEAADVEQMTFLRDKAGVPAGPVTESTPPAWLQAPGKEQVGADGHVANYTLDFAAARRMRRQFYNRTLRTKQAAAGFAMMPVLCAILAGAAWWQFGQLAGVAVVIVLLPLFVIFTIRPLKLYHGLHEDQHPMAVAFAFTEDSCEMVTDIDRVNAPWENINRLAETRDFLFLRLHPKVAKFVGVPKEYLTSAARALIDEKTTEVPLSQALPWS